MVVSPFIAISNGDFFFLFSSQYTGQGLPMVSLVSLSLFLFLFLFLSSRFYTVAMFAPKLLQQYRIATDDRRFDDNGVMLKVDNSGGGDDFYPVEMIEIIDRNETR